MRPRRLVRRGAEAAGSRPAVLRAHRRLRTGLFRARRGRPNRLDPRPPAGPERCGRSRPWSPRGPGPPGGHEIALRTIRASGPGAPQPGGSIRRTAAEVTARGCFRAAWSDEARRKRIFDPPKEEVREQTLTPRHRRSHGRGHRHVRSGNRGGRVRLVSSSEDERSASQRSSRDFLRTPTPATALRQPAHLRGRIPSPAAARAHATDPARQGRAASS